MTVETETKQEKRKPGRPKKEVSSVEEAPAWTKEEVAEFIEWKRRQAEIKRGPQVQLKEADPLYRKWKEDSKKVRGVFRCREPLGGSVTFCYREYKWDPVQWFTMNDGEIYEIPLGVAKHLNQRCNEEKHSFLVDHQGNPILNKNNKRSRMNFESTQFLEVA